MGLELGGPLKLVKTPLRDRSTGYVMVGGKDQGEPAIDLALGGRLELGEKPPW